MSDPRDRPVWNALSGRLSHLAVANGAAVRLDPGIGPFAALRDDGDEAAQALTATLGGADDAVALIERAPVPPPRGLVVVREGTLVQMVWGGGAITGESDPGIAELGRRDWPDMAALALATEPGPWAPETPRYGAFYGIRRDGRLAAMAGQRFLVPGHAEVSGVCTWPEFRGQGLARMLIGHVMRRFAAAGDTPFLHTFAHNSGAIRLYEAMGYTVRAEMALTILARA